ncbi:hypothetical protein GCM10022198_14550 [Klugiella xanthotipulae]|uniref:MepB protein n=2 Tax=Klugiella xanthotipulae TaxID=244735 RepID=A0A543I4Q6_9MICO|nr:hypothetical protein FB466_0348 [Klugiella xanthotipulae]
MVVDNGEVWADGSLHPDLAALRGLDLTAHGVETGAPFSAPIAEPESAEYAAHTLTMGGRAVRFRVAKTTPTKAGHFVTLWQRSTAGPIRPLDVADGDDLVIVATRSESRRGYFVFPVAALVARGVVSANSLGGKRALRVYAPWVTAPNAQARRTQAWQVEYFSYPVGLID